MRGSSYALKTALLTLLSGAALAAEPAVNVTPVPYVLACATTAELEAALKANGETLAARGQAFGSDDQSGPQAQFWINPATQDWSVVFANASGQSCLVAAGTRFRAERPPAKAPPPPADRAS